MQHIEINFTAAEQALLCRIVTHPDVIGLTNGVLSSMTMSKIYGMLARTEVGGMPVDLAPEPGSWEETVMFGPDESIDDPDNGIYGPTPPDTEHATIEGPPNEVAQKLREQVEQDRAEKEVQPPAADDVPPHPTLPEEEAAGDKEPGLFGEDLATLPRSILRELQDVHEIEQKQAQRAVELGCGFVWQNHRERARTLRLDVSGFAQGHTQGYNKFDERSLNEVIQARRFMVSRPVAELKHAGREVLRKLSGYLGGGSVGKISELQKFCGERITELRREQKRAAALAKSTQGPRHANHERYRMH
jgi:hypothetical protein